MATERNRLLLDFAKDWVLDGDLLRCRACKRAHIASRQDEDFIHRSDCKKNRIGGRPWIALQAILTMLPSGGSVVDLLATVTAQRDELLRAAKECEELIALMERPQVEDPQFGDEVRALGDRIGFGALMSSASASWKKSLPEGLGGEFCAGPCHVSVLRSLKIVRNAIAAVERAQSSASRVMQRTGDDCMRACVATYLGVDYEQVPELSGANWSDVLRDWLAPRGLGFFSATVGHDAFQDVFCKATVIVAGKSPRGILHAVIYRDGKLWHDPHPEGGGIESVQDVDVIFPLRMAVERAQAQGEDAARARHRDFAFDYGGPPQAHRHTHDDLRQAGMLNPDDGRTCQLCGGDVPSGYKHQHGVGICAQAQGGAQ